MKIYIKLLSGNMLTYTPRGVRNKRCKIETHKPHIENIILKHLNLSKETHFVKILTEIDHKEIDHKENDHIYYEENTEENPMFALVESYEEQKESYFKTCEDLLNKASALYYSLDENILSITEEQVYEDPAFEKFFDIYHIKNELGIDIWQLSRILGIPVILKGGFDPQTNTVRKMNRENASNTIIYYTHSIEECEKRLKETKI